jgi:uncharacterized protein (UPF0254 family)
MAQVLKIASGIFMLILVYLLVANATKTVQVINALSSPTLQGIRTLQGR